MRSAGEFETGLCSLRHRGPIASAWKYLQEAEERFQANHFYARLGRAGLERALHRARQDYSKVCARYRKGEISEWEKELAEVEMQIGNFEVNSMMSAARSSLLRRRRRKLLECIELRQRGIVLPAISG